MLEQKGLEALVIFPQVIKSESYKGDRKYKTKYVVFYITGKSVQSITSISYKKNPKYEVPYILFLRRSFINLIFRGNIILHRDNLLEKWLARSLALHHNGI